MADTARPQKKRRLSYVFFSVIVVAVIAFVLYVRSRPMGCAPTVTGSLFWFDTVKRGDMVVLVRGLGELVRDDYTSELISRIKIPSLHWGEIRIGQYAEADIRVSPGIVQGHVSRLGAVDSDGTSDVEISFDKPLPEDVPAGTHLDGTITIETLHNVLYVGRPVHGEEDSMVSIFKYTSDGEAAVRVYVMLGRASVNAMQILSGLNEGDKVILSDTSTLENVDRISTK